MSKSTSLKLYDETEAHKFTVSCDATNQKISHADNVKFKSPLAITHNAIGDASKSFTDMVNHLRGQDFAHSFVSDPLDGRIVTTENAIATEGIAYLAHKAAIESALSSEESRSTAATDALASTLNDAVIARINGGSALTSAKLNMISDRQQAITDYNTHVQTGIQETETLKESGDAAITTRIDTLMSIGEVDQTTLLGVVDTYQAADTAQLADIATLQSDFDALKVRIDDVLVAEEAGGSAAASYDVTSYTLQYGGSTFLKLKLTGDGQALYDAAVAGDQYELTYPDGSTQTMTVDGVSNYISGSSFYLNFTNTTQYHIFANNALNFTKV